MKRNILILSILVGLGVCFTSFNNMKLLCDEQKPLILSPAGPGSGIDTVNLLADEQKPIVLSISAYL